MNLLTQLCINDARDFLEAARICQSKSLHSPAVSLAVHSAIYAKDALVYARDKKPLRSKSHRESLDEVKALGLLSASALNQFASLLSSKNAAEYDVAVFSAVRASGLVKQAERFLATVLRLVDDAHSAG